MTLTLAELELDPGDISLLAREAKRAKLDPLTFIARSFSCSRDEAKSLVEEAGVRLQGEAGQ